jgi:hypothetical protein
MVAFAVVVSLFVVGVGIVDGRAYQIAITAVAVMAAVGAVTAVLGSTRDAPPVAHGAAVSEPARREPSGYSVTIPDIGRLTMTPLRWDILDCCQRPRFLGQLCRALHVRGWDERPATIADEVAALKQHGLLDEGAMVGTIVTTDKGHMLLDMLRT